MQKPKIKIILGSTREGRAGDKVAKWVNDYMQQQSKDMDVELLDLRDFPLPFLSEAQTPSQRKIGEYPNEAVAKWGKKILEADGFVVVTPEYNHSFPAVLKNAFDYVYHEWNRKAITFVSYGGSTGGGRSVEQLRQIAVELQMVPVRYAVHIVNYWDLANDKGELNFDAYIGGLKTTVEQLLWWTNALKTAREQKV